MLKVANSVINASQITGVLPVANGGTGVTTSTGTGNTVLSASPTFSGTAVFAALSGGASGTGYNFSGTAPAISLALDSSGNLGVGAASSGAKLQVYSTTSTVGNLLRGTGTTNGVDLQLNNSGGSLYVGVDNSTGSTTGTAYARFIYSSGNNPLQFYVFDSLRATIDASGNLGIGATANASAILDAQSTTKGVRMPNMTTTQKNAIASPAAGLMVFDTTLAKLCVYSGAAWETITSI
jgi:hypothetical protein